MAGVTQTLRYSCSLLMSYRQESQKRPDSWSISKLPPLSVDDDDVQIFDLSKPINIRGEKMVGVFAATTALLRDSRWTPA